MSHRTDHNKLFANLVLSDEIGQHTYRSLLWAQREVKCNYRVRGSMTTRLPLTSPISDPVVGRQTKAIEPDRLDILII